MEFKFPINEIFKESMVEIGPNLIPPGFSGDRRQYWDTVTKVSEVVNAMGEASANAQGLSKPITTAERLRNSEHTVYLLIDQKGGNGRGAITGLLKTGKKGLYVFDRNGQHFQVSPPCVLDFYVHESRQRTGLGKRLFEHMLQREQIHPVKMAIDRPSDKFLGFLNKHYGLNNPVKQMNNYVVYDDFFPNTLEKNATNTQVEVSPSVAGTLGKKLSANGLQQSNVLSPMGRYGAPRPHCSMGQIIHNQTSTIIAKPTEPTGISSSVPATNYYNGGAEGATVMPSPVNFSNNNSNPYNPAMYTQSAPAIQQQYLTQLEQQNMQYQQQANNNVHRYNMQQNSDNMWNSLQHADSQSPNYYNAQNNVLAQQQITQPQPTQQAPEQPQNNFQNLDSCEVTSNHNPQYINQEQYQAMLLQQEQEQKQQQMEHQQNLQQQRQYEEQRLRQLQEQQRIMQEQQQQHQKQMQEQQQIQAAQQQQTMQTTNQPMHPGRGVYEPYPTSTPQSETLISQAIVQPLSTPVPYQYLNGTQKSPRPQEAKQTVEENNAANYNQQQQINEQQILAHQQPENVSSFANANNNVVQQVPMQYHHQQQHVQQNNNTQHYYDPTQHNVAENPSVVAIPPSAVNYNNINGINQYNQQPQMQNSMLPLLPPSSTAPSNVLIMPPQQQNLGQAAVSSQMQLNSARQELMPQPQLIQSQYQMPVQHQQIQQPQPNFNNNYVLPQQQVIAQQMAAYPQNSRTPSVTSIHSAAMQNQPSSNIGIEGDNAGRMTHQHYHANREVAQKQQQQAMPVMQNNSRIITTTASLPVAGFPRQQQQAYSNVAHSQHGINQVQQQAFDFIANKKVLKNEHFDGQYKKDDITIRQHAPKDNAAGDMPPSSAASVNLDEMIRYGYPPQTPDVYASRMQRSDALTLPSAS